MKKPVGRPVKCKFPRFMSQEEFYRILRYCEDYKLDKYRLFFAIGGFMGLRSIEIASIQYQDFTRDFSKLTVRIAKSDKILTRYVPDQVKELLYSYIKTHKQMIFASGGYLFYSFNHRSKNPHVMPSTANQKLIEICDKLGMGDYIDDGGIKRRRIGLHSLRRLFASSLYRQTKSITTVRDVLGHARADITSDYIACINFDEEEKEVEKLSRRLIKPKPTYLPEDQINSVVTEKIQQIFTNFAKNS